MSPAPSTLTQPMQRTVTALVCSSALLLLACGQVEQNPGARMAAAGSPASGGSTALGGSAAGGAAAGSSGALGLAGAAAEPEPPPVDIAGRWAMFEFEDPVGVQLVQNGGELSGEGCAAGAPPLPEPESGSYCGAIRGSVQAHQANFGFSFESGAYHYSASVTVSADGQRMTGSFHAVQQLATPTAWLRLTNGQQWLPWDSDVSKPGDPLTGLYSLSLVSSSTGGSEYDATTQYRFFYSGRGIAGSLGSFWQSEMKYALADGVIEVGPVSATTPELAVALKLMVGAEGLTEVQALTASGNDYLFSVAPVSLAE